jgi:hypothetical protein
MENQFVETRTMKPAEFRAWLAEQGCPGHMSERAIENRARGPQQKAAPIVQPRAAATVDLLSKIRAEAIL